MFDQLSHRAGADPLVAAADLVTPLDEHHSQLPIAVRRGQLAMSSRYRGSNTCKGRNCVGMSTVPSGNMGRWRVKAAAPWWRWVAVGVGRRGRRRPGLDGGADRLARYAVENEREDDRLAERAPRNGEAGLGQHETAERHHVVEGPGLGPKTARGRRTAHPAAQGPGLACYRQALGHHAAGPDVLEVGLIKLQVTWSTAVQPGPVEASAWTPGARPRPNRPGWPPRRRRSAHSRGDRMPSSLVKSSAAVSSLTVSMASTSAPRGGLAMLAMSGVLGGRLPGGGRPTTRTPSARSNPVKMAAACTAGSADTAACNAAAEVPASDGVGAEAAVPSLTSRALSGPTSPSAA